MLERSEFHLSSSNAITPLKQEKSRKRVRSFAFQNKMFHLPSIKQSKAGALSGSSNPWQPSAPVWFWRMSQKRSSSRVDVELVFVFNMCMSIYTTGLSFLLLCIHVLEGTSPSLQWFPPLKFLTRQLLATSLLWRYPRRISSFGQTCSKLHLLGLQQNLQQVEKSFMGRRAEQRVGDRPQGKGLAWEALVESKCVGNSESRCPFKTVIFGE